VSWYNPIDDLKWLAGKAAGGYNSATGNQATYAPGERYSNNLAGTGHLAGIARGGGAQPAAAPTITDQTGQPVPWSLTDDDRKNLLSQQAGLSGQYADQAQKNYAQLGQQGQASLAALQAQAQGQNSVSAEQLRQTLGQTQAQQMSMAAAAPPSSAAGAARIAAIQMGRQDAGLSGQQAVAGLAERNQAQQQYAQQLQGLRQQDMSASLGGRQNAISGYGSGNAGAPSPGFWQQYGPAITAGAAYIASDRRLKTDIKGGDDEANKAIDGLRAYTYKYKDPSHGPGQQLGTTTQDLTRAGLGQAVIATPAGQYVHAGKLAGANTAMIAALGRRVATIEDAARGPAQEPGDLRRKQRMMQVLAGRDAGRERYRGDDSAGTYSTDGGGQ